MYPQVSAGALLARSFGKQSTRLAGKHQCSCPPLLCPLEEGTPQDEFISAPGPQGPAIAKVGISKPSKKGIHFFLTIIQEFFKAKEAWSIRCPVALCNCFTVYSSFFFPEEEADNLIPESTIYRPASKL